MDGKLAMIGYGAGGFRGLGEARWAHNRPHGDRVPLPKVGDQVLYRSNEFFDPISATVVAVNLQPGEPMATLNDPWPMLKLSVVAPLPGSKRDALGRPHPGTAAPRPYYVETREARCEGSAGWLPLDWQLRHRPPVGAA